LSVVYPVSTVQSRRYSLLDDSGRQRGMWRERDGTSALILQDDGGRWRLVAEMGPDGPRVQLHRAGGEPLVEFGARDADAVLTMHDRAGSPRLQLRVADGGGRLTFLDRNGEPVSEIGEGAQ